ncbi:two-component system response regulator [Halovenus rubra]|uniref:Two-component system response regulator n=2 Tax=Halovenus rubra TaxID=869890 RepID=A0ACC7E4A7_9EURY|nr:response regulator [Halovenus rubra]
MTEPIDVLLVDEDEETLGLTQTFLERKSDRIVTETETNPTQAPDRAVEGGFDCVVSDYRMPELDGLELCTAINERTEMPFFLFTGASVDEESLSDAVTSCVGKGAGTEHYDTLVADIEAAFE